MQNKTNDKMM